MNLQEWLADPIPRGRALVFAIVTGVVGWFLGVVFVWSVDYAFEMRMWQRWGLFP